MIFIGTELHYIIGILPVFFSAVPFTYYVLQKECVLAF